MTEQATDGMSDEQKVEILREFRNDSAFGLVSVDPDSLDGVLVYEIGARRTDGEPAIEIPHEDAHLVDESHLPGGSPPPKTFEEMLSEYGCVAKYREGFTYVVVDEDACSKRPTQSDDDIADALFETLAALEDLQAQLAGGATRSGVSKEEVWDRVENAYDLDEARAAIESSGYSRDGADGPEDFALDERVSAADGGDGDGA